MQDQDVRWSSMCDGLEFRVCYTALNLWITPTLKSKPETIAQTLTFATLSPGLSSDTIHVNQEPQGRIFITNSSGFETRLRHGMAS